MSTVTLRGTKQPQLQRVTGRYSPGQGIVTNEDWRGLDENLMAALARQYANSGCEFELTTEFGVSTLKTTIPGISRFNWTKNSGEVTIDTWEIAINAELASSYKNPKNVALVALELDDLTIFKAGVENKTTWSEVWAKLDATVPDDDEAELKRCYDRFLRGSDSYFNDIYTVRHTTNVSNRFTQNVADTNLNCIYTPAMFYSEAQNPAYWIFPMPTAFISALTANPSQSAANYLWGYLKGGSPRVTAANNRINITTEYKQFLWSTDEYGTVP